MTPVTHGGGARMRAHAFLLAALVLAILIPFREAIVNAVTNALNSVTSGG